MNNKSERTHWQSVLIVDDDETLISSIRNVLLSAGYSVLAAHTAEEGLVIAQTQKPQMIILDVILPMMKGREMCKRLKSNPVTKEIPVVFLTAKDSPDDIEAEMKAGAIAHLTKPVNAKELLATIKNVLG